MMCYFENSSDKALLDACSESKQAMIQNVEQEKILAQSLCRPIASYNVRAGYVNFLSSKVVLYPVKEIYSISLARRVKGACGYLIIYSNLIDSLFNI